MAAVVVGLSGCSVGDVTVTGAQRTSRPDAGVEPVDPADFAVALAQALCANIAPCCAEKSRPYDRGACERGYAGQPLDMDLTGWEPAALGRCISALGTMFASCFDPTDIGNAVDACPSGLVLEGTYPRGQAGDECFGNCEVLGNITICTVDYPPVAWPDGGALPDPTPQGDTVCHAKDGLFCPSTGAHCEKKRAVGAPCATSAACREAYCDPSGHCAPLKTSGASCTDTHQCGEKLFCDAPAGATGACSATKPDGASCRSMYDCQSSYCGKTQVCENPFLESVTKAACVNTPP